MNSEKNNSDRNPEESNVKGNEKNMSPDYTSHEEQTDRNTDTEKRKITIEKGKKPIDFDDLFF